MRSNHSKKFAVLLFFGFLMVFSSINLNNDNMITDVLNISPENPIPSVDTDGDSLEDDFELSLGKYGGTYDFNDHKIGGQVVGDNDQVSVSVNAVGTHYNVLEIKANDDYGLNPYVGAEWSFTGFGEYGYSFSPPGYFEFWFRFDGTDPFTDINYNFKFRPDFMDFYTEGDDVLKYVLIGNQWNPDVYGTIGSISPGEWHHLSIYVVPAEASSYIINFNQGEIILSHNGAPLALNDFSSLIIECEMLSTSANGILYIDALGSTWDGYTQGSNLSPEITLDPNNPDTDGDGLNDGYEFNNNMNPLSIDSDGDTLLDGDELNTGYYEGTYDFNDGLIPVDFNSIGDDRWLDVEDVVDTHFNVLGMNIKKTRYDIDEMGIEIPFSSSISDGDIEFWLYMDNTDHIDYFINIQQMEISIIDGLAEFEYESFSEVFGTVMSNTWYHFRIQFEDPPGLIQVEINNPETHYIVTCFDYVGSANSLIFKGVWNDESSQGNLYIDAIGFLWEGYAWGSNYFPTMHIDPSKADTDDDGLSDWEEINYFRMQNKAEISMGNEFYLINNYWYVLESEGITIRDREWKQIDYIDSIVGPDTTLEAICSDGDYIYIAVYYAATDILIRKYDLYFNFISEYDVPGWSITDIEWDGEFFYAISQYPVVPIRKYDSSFVLVDQITRDFGLDPWNSFWTGINNNLDNWYFVGARYDGYNAIYILDSDFNLIEIHELYDDPTDIFVGEDSMSISRSDGVDIYEILLVSDPTLTDTDGDMIPDGWEVEMGFNPWDPADASDDTDGDLLTTLEEYNAGTNAQLDDSDFDGVTDSEEIDGTLGYITDPLNPDTDGDGIFDLYEFNNGLNPQVDDSLLDLDGDLFKNWEEYYLGTKANDSDTDGDGVNDRDEWTISGPVIDFQNMYLITNPLVADTDGDGYPDGFGVDGERNANNYLSHKIANSNDRDQDGFPDSGFPLYGTLDNDIYDADYDDDFIMDGYENQNSYHCDPYDPDTEAGDNYDGDDLTNYEEILLFNQYGSEYNPSLMTDLLFYDHEDFYYWAYNSGYRYALFLEEMDSDNDGLYDDQEVKISGTNLYDYDMDSDNDGLVDGVEVIHFHTNPNNVDTDGDLIMDGDESYIYKTNPARMDTDSDEISDWDEITTYGTNPTSEDSDFDMLIDYDEIFTYLSDPLNGDSDDDGLTDGEELEIYGTVYDDWDSDGDLIPDGWEVDYYYDPFNPADAALDLDVDGLTTYEEFDVYGDHGDYPATYSFEGGFTGWSLSGTGSGEIYLDHTPYGTPHREVMAIAEWNIYGRKVAENVYSSAQDFGTIEFWFMAEGSSNDCIMDLRTGDGSYYDIYAEVAFMLQFAPGNQFLAKPGGSSVNIGTFEPKTWYHIRIDFECRPGGGYSGLNQYETRYFIDDIDKGAYAFWNNKNNIPQMCIITDYGLASYEHMYYDAFGYSWAPPYTIGDNKLMSYSSINPNNPDTDSDLMPDGWEVLNVIDPLVNDAGDDFDVDDLTNLQEYNYGTDPNDADTDGDLMPDGWEVLYGYDPLNEFESDPDPNGDDDNDGLANLQEFYEGTNPIEDDSDEDGFLDGWEVLYGFDPNDNENPDPNADLEGDGLTNSEEHYYGTNPHIADTDFDDVSDYNEISGFYNGYITDPTDDDTDDDGIKDGDEMLPGRYGTNPLDSDTDDDGLEDGEEVSIYSTDPLNPDSDGDEMPDGWEVQYGLNPMDENDALLDLDSDNLDNLDEFNYGTIPTDSDSDDDLLEDGDELFIYFCDPTDSDSDDDGLGDGEEILGTFGSEGYITNPNNPDSDYDGLSDYIEWTGEVNIHFAEELTDPTDPDSDNDGLTDSAEIQGSSGYFTNPNSGDTDGDNLKDGWEILYGLNPLVWNDPSSDDDEDGLILSDESDYGTDPLDSDTDDDGLEDGEEVNIYNTNPIRVDTDWDGLNDFIEIDFYGTSPLSADSDSDGMTDSWEIENELDPNDSGDGALDNDGDGYTNFEEFLMMTDPNSFDSDGDGIPNSWEIQYSLDPMNPMDASLDYDNDGLTNKEEYLNGANPWNEDSDEDLMKDGLEVDFGLDPNDYSDRYEDLDGDDLINGLEVELGTELNNKDSDHDGMDDGWEYKYGLDPLSNLDAEIDTDGDGYTNLEEFQLGLNPTERDQPSIDIFEFVNKYSFGLLGVAGVLVLGVLGITGLSYNKKKKIYDQYARDTGKAAKDVVDGKRTPEFNLWNIRRKYGVMSPHVIEKKGMVGGM